MQAVESAADSFTTQLLAARATAIRTLHRIANSLDIPIDQSHHDIREARLASLAILKIPLDREAVAPSLPRAVGGAGEKPEALQGQRGSDRPASIAPQPTPPTPHPVPERSEAPPPRPLIPLPSNIPRGKDLLAVVGSTRSREPFPTPQPIPLATPRSPIQRAA